MVDRYTMAAVYAGPVAAFDERGGQIAASSEGRTQQFVLASDYDALAARLAEAEARHRRVMSVIRPFCAKYTPDLLAEFDAAAADSAPAVGAARYRLQAKADPYKWADFDAKLWNLIVVPADQPSSSASGEGEK